MTLEFAKQEADRRTRELGTAHYVLPSKLYDGEYLVTTHDGAPYGYTAVYMAAPPTAST